MRPLRTAALGLVVVALASAASAQTGSPANPMHGHQSMMSSPMPVDGRELVRFPPEMRSHMLANMRDHVQTLNDILQALGAGDYDGAAKIAVERLGLDSPSAAACKPNPVGVSAPAPGSMDEMMAQFMPEPMRTIGLSMHTSASEFAIAAERAVATPDATAVVAALGRVTQNCAACHAGYRLQ